MGWATAKALYHHIDRYNFPAFLRRDPAHGPRAQMYTCEPLILKWEIEQAKLVRERVIAEQPERQWRRKHRGWA